MVRRTVGIGLSLVLLQLTFKSSDLACAKHDTQRAQVAHHAVTDQPVPDAADHDHEPAGQQTPCEIPAQSDCCQALVSCSITLGIGACDAGTALRRPPIMVVAAATHAPAYLIRPPEPPPPKA